MENTTKFRILYLYQLLARYSDIDHPITTNELISMLKEQHDIDVNRNTIGKDLEILHESGLQIEVHRSTQNRYYYDGRTFDIPEIKLLLDAVSSSKFITEKKSEQLIEKLLTLLPEHRAVKLRRHVYATDRVKSDNERGYYIVDAVNDAIEAKKKLSFFYTDYDVHKKRYRTNDGHPYTVSPYAMMWDGDYYYLRGYCDERQAMRNFRLDRIEMRPVILEEDAVEKPESFSLAEYSKSVFRMYDTDEPELVTLQCHVSVMKVIIDNFGIDVNTTVIDDEYFQVTVSVCPSPTFYSWVFGFAGKIKILLPDEVAEGYREMGRTALDVL